MHISYKLLISRLITRLILLFESLRDALWRVFFWSLLFFGIWLFDWPSLFAQPGYYGALCLYIIGLIFFLFQDIQKFRWPDRHDIDRRIERDNNLEHRPLTSTSDTPFYNNSSEQNRLWHAEQSRKTALLKHVQSSSIKAKLATLDHYSLRLIAAMIFISGFLAAGPEWQYRILYGLLPFNSVHHHFNASHLTVSILPPEYTKISQTTIQGAGAVEELLKIPAGSQIKINTQTQFGHPTLYHGDRAIPLTPLENHSYNLKISIPEYAPFELSIYQLFTKQLSFRYEIIHDKPPQIAHQGQLEKLREEQNAPRAQNNTEKTNKSAETNIFENGDMLDIPMPEAITPSSLPEKINTYTILDDAQVQIPLSVYDDYGVQSLSMHMQLDPMIDQAPIGWEEKQTRSIMSPADSDFNLSPVYNFTDNPWAGLPVIIHMEVVDILGQKATLSPISLPLPERSFEHPVAQKLVSIRKSLAWEPQNAVKDAISNLNELILYPQDFENDLIVLLSLRTASSRLKYSALTHNNEHVHTKAVMALLWDTALRIEDGNLSLAARNLREAQMAMEDALQRENLDNAEIAKAMQELREAMAEYLIELQKELQKQFSQGQDNMLITPEMLAEMFDPESLSQFLDQMQSEALDGNRENAQEMLSQLQRMLDLLNPNIAGPMPQDMQAMAEGINELQELIDKQTDLKNQTKDQAKDLEKLNKTKRSFGDIRNTEKSLLDEWGLDDFPPAPLEENFSIQPSIDTSANQTEQEALRYVLGELMITTDEALGNIPEGMGLAEGEMRGSSTDLKTNRPDLSVPHQEKAIEHLRDAQDELQEQLEQRMQEMTGDMAELNDGQNGGQGQRQYDPLGRPLNDDPNGNQMFPGSRVKIPDEAERRRVEEILKILRDRSGELFRPREELEYFRRLLRQF